MEDRDWDRLIRQLRAGQVAPFLGAGACHGTLEMAGALAGRWADEYDYPFEDRFDLARVMRYVAVLEDDLTYVKGEFLRRHFTGITAPNDPDDPHVALARFPLPLYLTTNYDDLLTRSLRAAGRDPRRVLCPWYDGAPYDPDAFVPPPGGSPADEPVVYHLHGHDGHPESLVLTEDDYIQFLVALIEDRNKEEDTSARVSLVPPAVQEALARRPLLFVGYSLRDWTFQVLLQGLVKGLPTTHRRSHISVQMLPLPDGATDDQRRSAEEYLDRYFADLKVSVYWGSARDFFRELNRRAGGTP
ncbi:MULTISPECIES: SIR2 family NAD-dependent protein deacylase [Actinomadura]|uniref:SIR2 family NAD-dependent protein deacylase n=1 Tax=Actinomadura TaxID=1988 RepID=UPI0004239FD5|nr:MULTISPECIES: SIR2 family protein [Actinomadura]